MVGVACWQTQDGTVATGHVTEAMAPIRDMIGYEGCLYTGRDFKKGFDNAGMERYKEGLHNIMILDSRGGHICQEDMEEWVTGVYKDPMFQAGFDRRFAVAQFSPDEGIKDEAYALRTMFSHCRERRRQRRASLKALQAFPHAA